jgi:cyclopropane fatty-acyl-phospholipid synthase-like methyltransferase
MNKPYAPSCERNQDVILHVLKSIISSTDNHLLEIGSGTGQHAVFMAPNFPWLQWHTADLKETHIGMQMWLDEAHLQNIVPPVTYKAGSTELPQVDANVVFTANTLHIMSWDSVQTLIAQLGNTLKKGAKVLFYGPFNYSGKYTSQSNVKFDTWLKQQEAHRGIRDYEKVVELMAQAGLNLQKDIEMPSNNRILYFKHL